MLALAIIGGVAVAITYGFLVALASAIAVAALNVGKVNSNNH